MLDEATGKWGIRINRVELKSIDPPADDPGGDGEADARRARPPRGDPHRRGRQAVADPHRRGREAVAVLRAEGAKQAAILRAEGEAKAIDTVFDAIHAGDPDPELLSYQYLQMLPAARAGRGEQDLGHPVGVHAGAGGDRGAFGAGTDAAAGAADMSDRRPR